MTVKLIRYPKEEDWFGVKERALVTIGKHAVNQPSDEWKHRILEARHSPIRYLMFSFYLEDIPYWVSVHLCRHIHAQPYVKTQRNDRQVDYDRNEARQDMPVSMIWDMNAEELMVICEKRLCVSASKETRNVVKEMAKLVIDSCPEFNNLLKPKCEWSGGNCYEFYGCKKLEK